LALFESRYVGAQRWTKGVLATSAIADARVVIERGAFVDAI
jgi:hypothetical protein